MQERKKWADDASSEDEDVGEPARRSPVESDDERDVAGLRERRDAARAELLARLGAGALVVTWLEIPDGETSTARTATVRPKALLK